MRSFKTYAKTMATDGVLIPLSNGGYAVVDGQDAHRVLRHVWHRDNVGYPRAHVKVDGRWRLVRLHRFLLDDVGTPQIDHADRDKLNNRRANLRPCSPGENTANSRKRSGTSSRFKGVSWHKRSGKWGASIKIGAKQVHLGLFEDEQEAACAYAERALVQFGEFARVDLA